MKNNMPHINLFSVDLPLQAKQHIIFLRNLHKHGITINDRSDYEESFRRYSDLWLPFVHKHGYAAGKKGFLEDGEALIPPGDIAWMWHCHRLAPYRYARFVCQKFSLKTRTDGTSSSAAAAAAGDIQAPDDSSSFQVLDASHPFVFQLENNDTNETLSRSQELADISRRTRELFLEMYPNESFFLKKQPSKTSINSLHIQQEEAANKSTGPGVHKNTQLAGFDVVESCIRQATFLWQVSGPRYSAVGFLEEGASNYAKFLRLMGEKSKPQFLVPTYQIDLMWHTHMLASIAKYHKDNVQVNGCTLEHDDSLNDRSEGGKLDTNFKATRKLWDRVYGVEYKVPGGMYRGEPPAEYFRPGWAEDGNEHLSVLNGVRDGVGTNPQHPMTLAHLIGQVGASSHGREEWMSIDAPEAFLEAKPKSITHGVKDGYIFGRESKGLGHYSFKTREAFNVIIKRIEAVIEKKRMVIKSRAIWAHITRKAKKREIEELEFVKSIAILRRDAAGPSAEMSLPTELQKIWKMIIYDSFKYYTDAARCGVCNSKYFIPTTVAPVADGSDTDGAGACGGGGYRGDDGGGSGVAGGGACFGGGCGGG